MKIPFFLALPANHKGIRSARRPPSGAGFTLIELLAVIAVLAMLGALSFGMIGWVRESGRAAVCTSNLRQLGSLVMLYTAENNGTLPQSTTTAGGSGAWCWFSYYRGAYGPGSPVSGNPMGGVLPLMAGYYQGGSMTLAEYTKAGAKHIFNCPSNRSKVDFCSVGYVSNRNLMTFGSSGDPPKLVSRVEKPSQIILLADNNSDGPVPRSDLWSFDEWDWNTKIGFHRHSGKANALFLDRSVRALTPGDITPNLNIKL